jgi:arsenite methyltransferase
MTETVHETVRRHYAEAARAVLRSPGERRLPQTILERRATEATAPATAPCCGDAAEPGPAGDGCCSAEATDACCADAGSEVFGPALYDAVELAGLPDAAVLASLGCGNPTAVAELHEGETVLDLGCGGGIDVLLSARRVGPSGRAIGLDMTDEMLALARRNATRAGAANVEFVHGTIEDMPLPDKSVDVVISNCVINLAADKSAVFREITRVLRPAGRVGVSDIVALDALSEAERAERGSLVACIAGALSFGEYESGLRAAGLVDVEITATHSVADGLFGAIVRARKPA